MRIISALMAGAAAAVTMVSADANAGAIFDSVKQKGFVQCGVNSSGLPGFASVDAQNNWSGLDIDLCKAVAAAMFGDVTKVKYTGLTAKERFTALQSGRDRPPGPQRHLDALRAMRRWASSSPA